MKNLQDLVSDDVVAVKLGKAREKQEETTIRSRGENYFTECVYSQLISSA